MIANDPLVSICCITYNHEKYIRDAIEGFLIQKTTFPIEIIIHDDASTDNTPKILKEYELKYPDLIKPIYQSKNQHSMGIKASPNFIWPIAKGKYIATCEGDDFWIDPFKIQKQVEFMEANSDYILCFTNSMVVNERKEKLNKNMLPGKVDSTFTHMSMPIDAPTATRLFRNKHLDLIPKSFNTVLGSDTYLLVWQSKFGKIKYHSYISSAYRITNQGVWAGIGDFQKARHSLETYFAILDIIDTKNTVKFFNLILYSYILIKIRAGLEDEISYSRKIKIKILDHYIKKQQNLGLKKNLMLHFRMRYFIFIYIATAKLLKRRTPAFLQPLFNYR